MISNEIVLNSINKLDKWIENNGWAGFDPYDIREFSFLIKLERIVIARRLIHRIEILDPLFFRKLLRIKKRVNAKAMGLFADGFLNLYNTTGQLKYYKKAEEAMTWLENNYSKGYSGKCWGYPFDWQSRVFIPKKTPSAVVSSIVGNAYWSFYKTTREKNFLSECESICNFFLNDLNIDKFGSDKLCFSYTPVDNFHVNNANLFAAEFLIRIGKETDNAKFIETGLKATNYSLAQQNEDGSICYWGKDQMKKCNIDHFHSGFEIRSLYSIWKLTQEEKIYSAVKNYYNFYLKNLYKNKTIPKHTPKKINPINIHSCTEAILCNLVLMETFHEGKNYLYNSLDWTIKNMQHKEGWFIFMIINMKGIKRKVKIPYIRWGQAWMLYALSKAYSHLKNHNLYS
ncbi:MAG: hypothetical protein JSW11_20785 [Candidatus Heimdallarchaeota archaeon]|nr:MAG: hypothetical protein JSW11_20785 [Candidatus Heimdallarchaeota archaeon]